MSKPEFLVGVTASAAIIDHIQRYKADILRWRIVRPSQSSWGFFWDPEIADITFFPDPARALAVPCAQTLTRVESTFDNSPSFGRLPHVPVFAGLTDDSGQLRVSDSGFYTDAKRFIGLQPAYSGYLHTVRVGTKPDDPHDTAPFAKLILDTGSSITWILDKDAKLLGTTDPLNRYPGAVAYNSGAEKIEPAVIGELKYLSQERVAIELHRGPFYLVGRPLNDAPYMNVCRSDDFIFGVATAASLGVGTGQMDGVLGMSLTKSSLIGPVVPDLLINKLSTEGHITLERFTVALGRGNQTSIVVIGEHNPSAAALVSSEGWTRWIPSASRKYWSLFLDSITISGNTCRVMKPVILDTGSSYSYLPQAICDWLVGKLKGEKTPVAQYICPRDQPPEDLHLNFRDTVLTMPLQWLLDPNHCKESTDEKPSAYAAVHPGLATSTTTLSYDSEVYILGNFLLRGLVIEFERLADDPPGRIRIARRKRD